MTAKEIFPSLGEFQKYSDGMVADTSIEQLMPSIRSSIRDINELQFQTQKKQKNF